MERCVMLRKVKLGQKQKSEGNDLAIFGSAFFYIFFQILSEEATDACFATAKVVKGFDITKTVLPGNVF